MDKKDIYYFLRPVKTLTVPSLDANRVLHVKEVSVAAVAFFSLQAPSAHFIETLEDSEHFKLSYADTHSLYDFNQQFERFGHVMAELLSVATEKSKRKFLTQTAEDQYFDLLKTQPHLFTR